MKTKNRTEETTTTAAPEIPEPPPTERKEKRGRPRKDTAPAPEPVVAEVAYHPASVAGLYSMMGFLQAQLFASFGKIPPAIARQVFVYTPQEIEALTEPTCRVMNKYAGWMMKFQDEFALVTMLTGMAVNKFSIAMAMAKMQAANIPPNGSQPKSEETDKKPVDSAGGQVQ